MRIGLGGDHHEVRPHPFQIRHGTALPPRGGRTESPSDRLRPCRLGGDLTIHHAVEGPKKRNKTIWIPFEDRQHLDHGFYRGDAMTVGFASNPIIAGPPWHEPDPWQCRKRRVELHHLARLGPGSIDHEQRPWWDGQGFRGNRSGTWEQERCARLDEQFLDPWMPSEFDTLMQFALTESQMGHPRGSNGHTGFPRVLEKDDPGGGLDGNESDTPADRCRSMASGTGLSWLVQMHRDLGSCRQRTRPKTSKLGAMKGFRHPVRIKVFVRIPCTWRC